MKFHKFFVLGLVFVLFTLTVQAEDDWMICGKYPDLSVLCGRDNATLPEKPPVDYIISGAEYRGTVGDETASITAIYDVMVLKDGWVEIPLLSSDVALIDVKLDGKKISLLTKNGIHELVMDESGDHRLEVEFLAKVYSEAESYSVKFRIPSTSVSRVWFDIPKTNLSVSIGSSFEAETTESGGKTHVYAALTSTESFSMKWLKEIKIPEPETLEPKIYAEVYTLFSVGEGIVSADTTVEYSIVQAGTAHFAISLPVDVDVLSVTGSRLKDWRIEENAGRKIIDVYLSSETQGKYSLNIKYEKSLGSTSAVSDVPEVQVLGVEREKGFMGIEASTNVEITATEVSGLNRIDIKELPYQITGRTQRPILLAYKYLEHPCTIILDVKKHEEVAVLSAAIDSASYITLVVEDGKRITKALYYVKNNRKQFLELDLPPNSRVWSAFVSGNPVKPAKSEKGTILIPLSKSTAGDDSTVSFPVEVVYITEAGGMGLFGSSSFMLPKVDIPVSQASLVLYLPEQYDFLRFSGDLKPSRQVVEYKSTWSPAIGASGAAPNVMLEEQVADLAEFEGAVQKAAEKGVLPVQVSVPQQGRIYKFSKLIVTEDQQPRMRGYFVNSELYFWFNLLLFLAVLFVGFKVVKELTEAADVWGWLSRRRLWIILLVLLAAVVKYLLPGTFSSALTAAVFVLFVGLIYFVYKKILGMEKKRRERKSTESRLRGEITDEE